MSALEHAIAIAMDSAIAPLISEVRALRTLLEKRASSDPLESFAAITGKTVRAAAAFERRHREVLALAVAVGRRRLYRRSEVLELLRRIGGQ